MRHAPARRVASVAALSAALAVVAGCGGADDEPPAAPTTAADDTTEAPAEPAAPPDLSTFVALDRAGWQAVAAAPAEAEGQQVVVYAAVSRVYAAADGSLSAGIATSHPATDAEGTAALLRADPPELFAEVAAGDVLLVHAEVLGAYAGRTGGAVRIPELRVVAVEDVGPYDTLADVALGTPERGTASIVVPVTATNTTDTVMEYRVEVVALSADGAAELDAARPRFGALEPGQAATLDVRFTAVPPDAQIVFGDVDRLLPETP